MFLPVASFSAVPDGFFIGSNFGANIQSYNYNAPALDLNAFSGDWELHSQGLNTQTISGSMANILFGYQSHLNNNLIVGVEVQMGKDFFATKSSYKGDDDTFDASGNTKIYNKFSSKIYFNVGRDWNNGAYILAKLGVAFSFDNLSGSTKVVDGETGPSEVNVNYSKNVPLIGPSVGVEIGYPLVKNLYVFGSYTLTYLFSKEITGIDVSSNNTGTPVIKNLDTSIQSMSNDFSFGVKYFF